MHNKFIFCQHILSVQIPIYCIYVWIREMINHCQNYDWQRTSNTGIQLKTRQAVMTWKLRFVVNNGNVNLCALLVNIYIHMTKHVTSQGTSSSSAFIVSNRRRGEARHNCWCHEFLGHSGRLHPIRKAKRM